MLLITKWNCNIWLTCLEKFSYKLKEFISTTPNDVSLSQTFCIRTNVHMKSFWVFVRFQGGNVTFSASCGFCIFLKTDSKAKTQAWTIIFSLLYVFIECRVFIQWENTSNFDWEFNWLHRSTVAFFVWLFTFWLCEAPFQEINTILLDKSSYNLIICS